MDDLVKRLRDAYPATQDMQHTLQGDLMDEAADAIEALQARVAELETEAERRDEQIRDMIEASGQTCACGYDKASDICLGHLSHFRKSVATARRDAFEEAAKYHDNFLMTQTGTSVEKVVASTEAIRALAEKG